MPPSNESTFTIPTADLDTSLLPEHARVPGTDAFRDAVTDLIRTEYGRLGGRATVVMDDTAGTTQVTWRPGADRPDPLDVALAKLESGQHREAVRLLEVIRFQQPQRSAVFYNLGMALSDLGRLDSAVRHLRTALALSPGHTNALVGLGVALARQQKAGEAIQAFRRALAQDVDNAWAHKNLGACLLNEAGRAEEAEGHLRRAAELLPGDQQSLFGLGKALLALGRKQEADAEFIRVIDLDDTTPGAEKAKEERNELAGASFRTASGGAERADAVMYCLAALERFENMPHKEVQRIGFEIAILGQQGLDTNDAMKKYTLRSLPGQFSGLQLVSIMYVAFQAIAPDEDVGFDLSREYRAALALHQK